ncbi:DUF3368 domain-containing protein [Oscillatoria amoena NRMC-F 0135]|nr:DUF3368 domain-containing protein [Geitlerinema splendidum]MDL5051874.1 DUF3368 domain-containing protein [Oscillatoria amoena NRMC-F 0135]
MTVVSNTTPLSELAKVGKLELVQAVFGKIIIPQEVYDELTTGSHPAANLVPSADWIEVRVIQDRQRLLTLQEQTGLDLGESAAIILAEELSAVRLLIDERAGRQIAQSRNIPIVGTMGLLLLAKQLKLIPSIKDVLDELRNQGQYISQKLYEDVLAIAQELF